LFSGYYRVNYDEKYWIKLFDYLQNNNINTIHEINRAALIDDLMNFARADYINYKIVIPALRYLTRENHYLPWRAFYNNLPYLNNRFRGRSIEELYKVRIIERKRDKIIQRRIIYLDILMRNRERERKRERERERERESI